MSGDFTNQQLDFSDLPKFEEVKYHAVSLKLRTKSLLQWVVLLLFFSTGAGIYFFIKGFDEFSILILSVIFIYLLVRLVDIFLKQKQYGFALREKDILFKQGYIYHKTTVIPFNRIQHSAINRSFLDKLFGISTLKIYTAGGSGSDINIPGLLPDLALQLNQTLSKKVSENV